MEYQGSQIYNSLLAIFLTIATKSYSFVYILCRNQTNHARCWNIQHGSNPTLRQPVNGLSQIIHATTHLVLHYVSPTDLHVGMGCLAFGRHFYETF
jgi:hypothetical protein